MYECQEETIEICTICKCSPWVFKWWLITRNGVCFKSTDECVDLKAFVGDDPHGEISFVCRACYEHGDSGCLFYKSEGGNPKPLVMNDDGNLVYDGGKVDAPDCE